jgi:hypothetical protein
MAEPMCSCSRSHFVSRASYENVLKNVHFLLQFGLKGLNFFINIYSTLLSLVLDEVDVHFQFTSLSSFFSLQWLPELQHYAPGVPIVLAGTKLGVLFDNESMLSLSCIFECQTLMSHLTHLSAPDSQLESGELCQTLQNQDK